MWERFGPGELCPHSDNTAVSLSRAVWERGGGTRPKYKQDIFRQPSTGDKQAAEPGGAGTIHYFWNSSEMSVNCVCLGTIPKLSEVCPHLSLPNHSRENNPIGDCRGTPRRAWKSQNPS